MRNGSSRTGNISSAKRVRMTIALNNVPTATKPTVARTMTATIGSSACPMGTSKNSTNSGSPTASTTATNARLASSFPQYRLTRLTGEPREPVLGEAARQPGVRGGGRGGRAAAVRAVLRRAHGARAAADGRRHRPGDGGLRGRGDVVQRDGHSDALRGADVARPAAAVPHPAPGGRGAGDGASSRRASLERVGGVP